MSDPSGAATSVATNVTIYPVGGGAGLTVSGFGPTDPVVALNSSTVVVVTASGGVGPLGYTFTGLPPGCSAANVSWLPCQPTQVGNYTLRVIVFDSGGHRIGVAAALQVAPAAVGAGPAISSFIASPSPATLGQPLTLVVSVAGGTLPLLYVYTGLPAGCTTNNSWVLHCTPTSAGNYTVGVTVRDASGRTVSATTPLEVLRVSGPPTGSPTASAGLGPFEQSVLLGALFAAGALVVLALGAARRRRRERAQGRALVDALERAAAGEGEPPREG